MTRLPIESRLAVDRPDLPEYELNQACPVTGEVSGLEAHHIWRRSAGFGSWWVELPTGEIVGNRINLSSEAHYRVTVNKARIAYEHGDYARGRGFYWVENDEWTYLAWQPPTWDEATPLDGERAGAWAKRVTNLVIAENDIGDYAEDGSYAQLAAVVQPAHLEPGHDCPTCKRRVPIPKKKTSPLTKVFSTRVPVADAESFDELVEALAEHLGVKSKPHHKFWAIHYAAVAALQDESLKDALNGR